MNYIGAREGVPVPKVPYSHGARAEWVVCTCGHKGLGVERRTRDGARKSTKPKRKVEKPPCGTVEGYNWHRRQSLKNPGQPWPLPKEDVCGCRAAQAESSRLRRLQEKGDAA